MKHSLEEMHFCLNNLNRESKWIISRTSSFSEDWLLLAAIAPVGSV